MRVCGNCAYRQHESQPCPILKRPTASTDTCPYYASELLQCQMCGNVLVSNDQIVYRDGKTICLSCQNMMGTCQTCHLGQSCPFETDPSPLPKYVMATQQQGNMVMQTQVRNPERERQLCQTKCKCWDAELGCLKINGCCGNWEN